MSFLLALTGCSRSSSGSGSDSCGGTDDPDSGGSGSGGPLYTIIGIIVAVCVGVAALWKCCKEKCRSPPIEPAPNDDGRSPSPTPSTSGESNHSHQPKVIINVNSSK